MGLFAAGCGSAAPTLTAGDPASSASAGASTVASGGASAQPSTSAAPSPSAMPSASPVPHGAPAKTFSVATRQITFSRGSRSLPTTIWYPVGSGSALPAGRFPVILFSHGLHGLPAYYQQIESRLAAAGFVVAGPAYPFTNANTKDFNPADMTNQPADASAVITGVLKLDTKAGDRFAGHLDTQHIGAAGHSAGGFTTAGLLADKRDTRIKGAVVIAGAAMGTFSGPKTPVLFVHGDADPTVPYSMGHNAYASLKWPKAFLTEVGQGHGEYLGAGAKGFDQMMRTTLDFFRWTLYNDAAAHGRLKADAVKSGTTKWESSL